MRLRDNASRVFSPRYLSCGPAGGGRVYVEAITYEPMEGNENLKVECDSAAVLARQ